MKGIVLAGGTGTRLYPLTKVTNKHLLPVGRKPMIMHPIDKLREAGITDIIIVTGTEHMGDMISLLGSGKEYGCDFTYKVQDEANGIAGALKLCIPIIYNEPVLVILGDNIFEDDLKPLIQDFQDGNVGMKDWTFFKCRLFLKVVSDPERFSVATIENDKIIKMIEKPENPESNYCVTGLYLFDHQLHYVLPELELSNRGEYEITDVNNYYLVNGIVEYKILKSAWTDAGTFPSLQRANELANK